uniref:Uncharacterized protein n=1 Tax=Oryza glumipatula TaxID=40148 RepID=A0A0D9ZTV5_9ORYZ
MRERRWGRRVAMRERGGEERCGKKEALDAYPTVGIKRKPKAAGREPVSELESPKLKTTHLPTAIPGKPPHCRSISSRRAILLPLILIANQILLILLDLGEGGKEEEALQSWLIRPLPLPQIRRPWLGPLWSPSSPSPAPRPRWRLLGADALGGAATSGAAASDGGSPPPRATWAAGLLLGDTTGLRVTSPSTGRSFASATSPPGCSGGCLVPTRPLVVSSLVDVVAAVAMAMWLEEGSEETGEPSEDEAQRKWEAEMARRLKEAEEMEAL